jgi:hypothetical protein
VNLLLEHNADVYRVVYEQTLLDFAHTTQQQLTTYPEAREAIKDAIIAKTLLTRTAIPATPPSDPIAPQKLSSLSLPKIGLLCVGAVMAYVALNKLYAWVYLEQDEDVEDETATQEPLAKTDSIG